MLEAVKWYHKLQEYDSTKRYPSSENSSSKGFTKLMFMIINSFPINRIEEYIIQHPEEMNKQNNRGWTALMIAARNSNKLLDGEKIVNLLLGKKADINLQSIT